MAHGAYVEYERKLLLKYDITKVFGVTNLFKDIHDLREHRFKGTDTTLLSCILIDFERIQQKSRLTDRQKKALYHHFEEDLTQAEVAEKMGITQQAVSKHIDNAIAKIVIAAKEEENKND